MKCTISENPKITAFVALTLGGITSSYRAEVRATWNRLKEKGVEYSHSAALGGIALLSIAIEYNRSQFGYLSQRTLNLYQQAIQHHKTTAVCLFVLGYLSQKVYEESLEVSLVYNHQFFRKLVKLGYDSRNY